MPGDCPGESARGPARRAGRLRRRDRPARKLPEARRRRTTPRELQVRWVYGCRRAGAPGPDAARRPGVGARRGGHGLGGGRGVGHGKARASDEVTVAVELFEDEGEHGARRDGEWLLGLKDRLMTLADLGVNAPGGLLVAIDGVFNGPAVLVEVG